MTRIDRTGTAIARLFLYFGIAHNLLRFGYGGFKSGNLFGYLIPISKVFTGQPLEMRDLFTLAAMAGLMALCVALLLRDLNAPLPERQAGPWGSAALATLLASLAGIVMVVVATVVLRTYGWTLFVLLPAALGFAAVWIDSLSVEPTMGRSMILALVTNVLTGAGLILFAVEGVICVAMAAPLAVPLTMLGSALGYAVFRPRHATRQPAMFLLLLFVTPNLLDLEARFGVSAPVFEVSTSTTIAAPVEQVWRSTIARAELPVPGHLAFRAGIAYPRASWIVGEGMNATRYCDFSTGKLVEPVLRWEEPSAARDGVLRFTVVSNPSPMQEWTPYGQIHPPHLEGFLASRQGQFRLVRIDATHTRLEATTWYQHHMAPAVYWRWWSDYVIHRVHDEVLRHVKESAEGRVVRK